jgi:hypothetical protein
VEESRRVHSVGDGATDEGQPVKDHWGLIGVLEQDLVGDIGDNGQEDQAAESNANLRRQPVRLELMGERVARHLLEDAHGVKVSCCALAEEMMQSAGRRTVSVRKRRKRKRQKMKVLLEGREEAEQQDNGFVIVSAGLMTYLYLDPAYEIFRTGGVVGTATTGGERRKGNEIRNDPIADWAVPGRTLKLLCHLPMALSYSGSPATPAKRGRGEVGKKKRTIINCQHLQHPCDG